MDQVNDFFIKDTNGKFVTIATRDFKDGVNDMSYLNLELIEKEQELIMC